MSGWKRSKIPWRTGSSVEKGGNEGVNGEKETQSNRQRDGWFLLQKPAWELALCGLEVSMKFPRGIKLTKGYQAPVPTP